VRCPFVEKPSVLFGKKLKMVIVIELKKMIWQGSRGRKTSQLLRRVFLQGLKGIVVVGGVKLEYK
jgi:hypothetical protein